ncbi:hypothetical protein AVEN_14092-1 [Araneus ventricosus]|uniref:Uncharacterized protein n=1 Tax=Araneus ventricosus TaxID=182803 RepID=A0A4Y2FYY5_ARAVE|nr:hypothetical protein AVEN_14092-1 [Araneus ventricosus]
MELSSTFKRISSPNTRYRENDRIFWPVTPYSPLQNSRPNHKTSEAGKRHYIFATSVKHKYALVSPESPLGSCLPPYIGAKSNFCFRCSKNTLINEDATLPLYHESLTNGLG